MKTEIKCMLAHPAKKMVYVTTFHPDTLQPYGYISTDPDGPFYKKLLALKAETGEMPIVLHPRNDKTPGAISAPGV